MEIIKFKKLKNNIYEIIFDNDLKIKLYDDVIVKYNLIVNKVLDHQKFEEITNYNDSLGAYYDSIKKLNSKMRSENELRDFLKKKEYSNIIIDDTIDRLKKDGYLKRNIYIKSYINDQFNFSNDGPLKIKINLNKLGFRDNEIDPYLDLDFKSKVKRLIDKKIKINNKYSNYMLKEKINNYLIGLGYPKEMYIDYLSNISFNDKNILIKEIRSMIKKYSKKVNNDELKYFIKDKLYKKGYNSNEISEVLNEEGL